MNIYFTDIANIAAKLNHTDFENKNILITGASGMIGSCIVDTLIYLAETKKININIYAMSRNLKKLEHRFNKHLDKQLLHLIEHDVTCPLIIKDKIDYIIHAASNTHPIEYSSDPIGTIMTNVLGTYNLLEFQRQNHECRILLTSSVEIYGNNETNTPMSEKDFGYIDCNTLRAGYPESKRTSEALLQAYIEKYKLDGVIARLCRVYGPTLENDDSKAMTQFIKNAVNNKNIVLKSSGEQMYSYIYTADAVSAILKILIDGTSGEAYNISDEKSNISLKNAAEYLSEISKTEVVFSLATATESKGYSKAVNAIINADKIKKLGWSAEVNIYDGLRRTVTFLKESAINDRVGQ